VFSACSVSLWDTKLQHTGNQAEKQILFVWSWEHIRMAQALYMALAAAPFLLAFCQASAIVDISVRKKRP
jgi:hypothetical protein